MNTPFRIGLGPHRDGGVVCHNAKCGSRDAVTSVCRLKVSPNRCRDHVFAKPETGNLKFENKPSEGPVNPLVDLSPMPWGKHKGVPMQDVPASYMFWLWTQRGFENNRVDSVADYIRRNLSAFEQEYPDGIWR